MTKTEIAQLRELLAKATPGPWEALESVYHEKSEFHDPVWEGVYDADGVNTEDSWDNCKLIAAAVNNLGPLLSRLEQLEEALELATDALAIHQQGCDSAADVALKQIDHILASNK